MIRELGKALRPLSLNEAEAMASRYSIAVKSIISQFDGFNCIYFEDRLELRDYVLPSLEYINKHLVMVDSNDVLVKIDRLVEVVEHINDCIIAKNCKVICSDLNYELEYFDLIYFTYLWTNLTTNMLIRLMINFRWRRKLDVNIQGNCGCGCTDCCQCCTCNDVVSNEDYSPRPIQESYYTQWLSTDSYLERW